MSSDEEKGLSITSGLVEVAQSIGGEQGCRVAGSEVVYTKVGAIHSEL